MSKKREYNILFKKLDDLLREETRGVVGDSGTASISVIPQNEFDEIDELRRFSEEIAEPYPVFFTHT